MPRARSLVIGAIFALTSVPLQAQTRDNAPAELESADKLSQDEAGTENWTYFKPGLILGKYRHVIVQPTTVYDGPDAQFDGIEQADRIKFANIFTTALGSEMAAAYPRGAKAGSDTLRLHVTIIGARKTKGVVATATRVTTFGFATSAIKSVAGKPGAMTGSVLLAVEAFDAKTGELVAAGVRRRSPDALDIPATLSTTDTVKAIARDFAENIRKRLVNASRVAR